MKIWYDGSVMVLVTSDVQTSNQVKQHVYIACCNTWDMPEYCADDLPRKRIIKV